VRVTLLGPQRRPTLGAVAASLGIDGPVATITAGWQERESADDELREVLGSRDVNLRLYQRWLDVLDRDTEFAAAERRLGEVLEQVQDVYLLRLDYALRAVYAISRHSDTRHSDTRPSISRHSDTRPSISQHSDTRQSDLRHVDSRPGYSHRGDSRPRDQRQIDNGPFTADALSEAIAAVAELDATHLRRVNGIRGEFYARLTPHDRPVVAEHRAVIEGRLRDAAAVVIAGGHVGALADTLHLFNVAPLLRSPVIAWSAGAMALTDRIVLFGDRFPQGPGHPEVYGAGLSVLRGLVLLPHARARLLLDDVPRMSVLARRLAPALCVPLENGTRLDADTDGSCPPGTAVLAQDGRVTNLAAA